MRHFAILITSLLVGVAQWAHAEALVTIVLPPRASVSHHAVTLGEVAQITSPSLALVETLTALPLGRSPRMGESAVLTRAQIESWVKLRSRLEGAQIEWRGESAVVVAAAIGEVSGEALVTEARRVLAGWLSARASRFSLTSDEVRPVPLPAGKLALKARPLMANEPVRSRMQVWVEVWVDERFVRVVPIGFSVEAHGVALVASNDALPGEPLALEPREVPLSRMPALTLAEAPQYRARGAVRAGQVVGDKDIEPAPAVSRGQRARLLSVAGSVTVESNVDVLQDGSPGQMVRVRLPGSAGVVTAKVRESGVVEMIQ